jgi:hypothetical protein
MSIHEVSPEQFAESFHHYFQALAHDFGCTGRPSSEAWEQVSPEERHCLIAAARLTLMEVVSASPASPTTLDRAEPVESRRYFAKPGEAEWGC